MRLFTYGILQEAGDVLYRNVWTRAKMFDLGPYPAITAVGGDERVRGNIIKVTEKELKQFDLIEGVPTLYQREVVDVPGIGPCFIYVYQRPVPPEARQINHWKQRGADK